MPIEFSTCLDRDLLYARWHGDIDYEQFQEAFGRYLSDAHYRPGRPELIDHSGIRAYEANFNLIRSMLRQVNDQAADVPVSTHTVLFSPNETLYGYGRMYQQLAENARGIRVEVFRTEAEALTALNLPYPSIQALLQGETFLPAAPRPR